MVYKACTFGMEHGPCHTMPTVAVWTRKGPGDKRIWACRLHDEVLGRNLRKAGHRSGWRRTAIKDGGNGYASASGIDTGDTTAEAAKTGI